MTDTLWQRNPDWIGAELDDGVVMLDAESGNYFGLNPSASAIWDALEQPQSQAAIVARLRTRFAVSEEQCAAAVSRTLERLCAIGAVRQFAA